MPSTYTIFRGSPHTNLGSVTNRLIASRTSSGNVQTISTSTGHGIPTVGRIVSVSGVDSTVDGSHVDSSIALGDDIAGASLLTYSSASVSNTGAATPNGNLSWSDQYLTGGLITNIGVVNYLGTATTSLAHGLAVGDIIALETTLNVTLGAMVLSVPTSTTFKYASSTQTVANAATSGAWTKIPPVLVTGATTSTLIHDIAVTNRSPVNATYSIFAGRVPLAENVSITAGTTAYLIPEQIVSNGEKLFLCATNKDVIFHVAGEDL